MYYYIVARKKGYKLYKARNADLALIRDKDDNTIFRGTHYQCNQEFLKLTTL